MYVTLYKRPHGGTREIDIKNIRDEDSAWFTENGIAVSMEDCGFDTAVYADCGFRPDDDPEKDPDEIIVFAGKRNCEDTMADLRAKCEEEIATGRPRFD